VAGGVLDAAEVEDAKRILPEAVFKELYLAEPSDDQGNPFGIHHIAGCVGTISEDRPVAVGIDLAKSHDWTVVVGLDRRGAVCGFERWQGTWETTEGRILSLIGNVPTLVDSTGVGDPIVERLQSKRHNVSGFKFTSQSKQQLMEGLVLAIQQRQLRIPDGILRSELESFEYRYTRTGATYNAPEGLHDDCVVALALAWQQYRAAAPDLAYARPDGLSRISPWVSADERGEY